MHKKTSITIPVLASLLILVASPALGAPGVPPEGMAAAGVATERTLDLSSWFKGWLTRVGEMFSASPSVPEAQSRHDSVKGGKPDATTPSDPRIVIRPMADPVGDPDG